MKTFIILLRGVTPTGKNKVIMAPLRDALAEAGLVEVKTYIQSGNIIAKSKITQSEIEKLVHNVIERTSGGDIAVMARTREKFINIMKKNPFLNADTSRLYFSLLSSRPDSENATTFLNTDFSPDKIQIIDDVIYTLYATKYSDSRFNNNYFERRLKTAATTRNFNTMTKLIELSSK